MSRLILAFKSLSAIFTYGKYISGKKTKVKEEVIKNADSF